MFHPMKPETAAKKAQEQSLNKRRTEESLARRLVMAYDNSKLTDMNYALEVYLEPAVRIVHEHSLDWADVLKENK